MAHLAEDGHTLRTDMPGRTCPPSYAYSPRIFARPADVTTDVLYVIGGLYGNAFALDAIERLAAHESIAPSLVFNGDFHWFDADPGHFDEIQRRVMACTALRGNVETEVASDDDAAGCGCAYPESVPDDDVARSNAILARLRNVAAHVAGSQAALKGLPMHAVAQVGGARIALVHGDAWSLAGWRFAHDRLHGSASANVADAAPDAALDAAFELAAVDGFACSHTCAPALKATARGFVINNGAAGMANFAGTTHGVITRIATAPCPANSNRCVCTASMTGSASAPASSMRSGSNSTLPPGCDASTRCGPPGPRRRFRTGHVSFQARTTRSTTRSAALRRVAPPETGGSTRLRCCLGRRLTVVSRCPRSPERVPYVVEHGSNIDTPP